MLGGVGRWLVLAPPLTTLDTFAFDTIIDYIALRGGGRIRRLINGTNTAKYNIVDEVHVHPSHVYFFENASLLGTTIRSIAAFRVNGKKSACSVRKVGKKSALTKPSEIQALLGLFLVFLRRKAQIVSPPKTARHFFDRRLPLDGESHTNRGY